ncbi:MAG: ligand-gated channel, partial [Pseudomonadota bacterium]
SYAGTDVFTGGDTLAVKVVAYDQSVWDVTSYRSFVPGGSTNRIERQGLEIEASYALDSGWYADVAANFSTGDATLENGTVQDWRLNPQDDIRLTVGRKFGEELDISWELVAARRYDRGGANVAGYGVNNLRVTYAPQSGVLQGAEIRFSVENIFDKAYQPRLATQNATGRNVKLSLAKTF